MPQNPIHFRYGMSLNKRCASAPGRLGRSALTVVVASRSPGSRIERAAWNLLPDALLLGETTQIPDHGIR
jgi:hypothetical protein